MGPQSPSISEFQFAWIGWGLGTQCDVFITDTTVTCASQFRQWIPCTCYSYITFLLTNTLSSLLRTWLAKPSTIIDRDFTSVS